MHVPAELERHVQVTLNSLKMTEARELGERLSWALILNLVYVLIFQLNCKFNLPEQKL